MAAKKVSGGKLKQALEKFGSLQKANEELSGDNKALKQQNAGLKQDNAQLMATNSKMLAESKDLDDKLNHQKEQFQEQSKRMKQKDYQYLLFESFIAMVAGSPSVTSSVQDLVTLFRQLLDSGWQASKKLDDLRSLFVRTVMGDYLKCFRCENCGADFIVNRKPYYQGVGSGYHCPSCKLSAPVRADDSFLKAIVSDKQLENAHRCADIQKENDSLRPFKAFFSLPCEVCGKPIAEWTEENIATGIQGFGWCHTQCWTFTFSLKKSLGKITNEQSGT